jgi:hypothetical protein
MDLIHSLVSRVRAMTGWLRVRIMRQRGSVNSCFSARVLLKIKFSLLVLYNADIIIISSKSKIDICCFSAKHTALSMKSKDLLALNHDHVSELHVYTHIVVSVS